MAREIPIQNGRLETDLDANGHSIKNLPAGFPSSKQDVIVDLPTIRAGAAAGATAVQPSALSTYVNAAAYDSQAKKILLKNGTTTVAEVDATAFIKDGMVSSVAISGGNLVITFNTDAGKDPISIPITDIFNPSNYYPKTAIDDLLAGKVPTTRKVNNKALSEDVTLTASDVGAVPTTGGTMTGPLNATTVSFGLHELSGTGDALFIRNTLRGSVLIVPEPDRWDILARLTDIYTAIQQIAPEFTAKTYAVNDLCTYNGVVYRCKSGYTAMASSLKPDGDTTHWEAKKVSELFAPLASPAFTGTPTAPTPAAGDDSTKVATTEFVKTAVAGATPNLDYVMRVDPETGGIYYTTPDANANA